MWATNNFIEMIDLLWDFGFHLSILIAIYLVPVFIAYSRKLDKRIILTVLNVLFGWTFVVWIACAIWAIFGKKLNTEEK